MKRNARHMQAVVFLSLLLGVAGCGAASPDKFNDQIAEANKRLAKASLEFRDAYAPLKGGQPADAGRVKRAHENLKAVLNAIKEERKTIKVPSGASAENLHKAYDTFLQGQERLLDNEFVSIVRTVEAGGMGPAEKWSKIQAMLPPIQEKERNDYSKLQEVQRKFAEELSMKLSQPK